MLEILGVMTVDSGTGHDGHQSKASERAAGLACRAIFASDPRVPRKSYELGCGVTESALWGELPTGLLGGHVDAVQYRAECSGPSVLSATP